MRHAQPGRIRALSGVQDTHTFAPESDNAGRLADPRFCRRTRRLTVGANLTPKRVSVPT